MKRSSAILALVALCLAAPAYAIYSISDHGDWPKTWPPELEPLRKHSRTLVGPMVAQSHYLIPFNTREKFESAWPHLLKVKSRSAPIFLVRGPKTDFFELKPAGVLIHAPPAGQHENPATPEAPIPGVENLRARWMNTTYIELAVDGNVVDLNRIPLPADTPIIDERFGDKPAK